MPKQKEIYRAVLFCLFYATLATGLTWLFHDVLKTPFSAMEKLEDGVYDWVKWKLVKDKQENIPADLQAELDKIALINIDEGSYDNVRNEVKNDLLATCLNLLAETDIEAVFLDIAFNKISIDSNVVLFKEAIKKFEEKGKILVLPYIVQTQKGFNTNGDSVIHAIPIIHEVKHKGFSTVGSYANSDVIRFFRAKIDTHEYAMYKLIHALDPNFSKYPHLKNINNEPKEINYVVNIKEEEGNKVLPYAFDFTEPPFCSQPPFCSKYVDSLYHYAISGQKKCKTDSSLFCKRWNRLKGRKIAIIAHLEHYTTRQMQYVSKANTPIDEEMLGSIVPLNIYLNLVMNSWIKKGSLWHIFIINLLLALFIISFKQKDYFFSNKIAASGTKLLLSLILFMCIATIFYFFYIKLSIIISLLLFQKGNDLLYFLNKQL